MPSRRSTPTPASAKPAKRDRLSTTSFLLEIGSEELPWQMIQPAMTQLARLMEEFLSEQRLSHGRILTFGTPRRLAVRVQGLAAKQTPVLQETLGPSRAVAFDAQGHPTKAAEGFAKSQGVDVRKLETRETSKGVYLCAVKQEKGLPVDRVFTEHLSTLLQQLTFPKTMRWNASGVRYPRPVRWLVALVGARALSIEFAGVRSGSRSWGHRFVTGGKSGDRARKGIEIQRPDAYEATLERAGVIVDPARRRAALDRQLSHLARAVKGLVYRVNREELLDQAVFSLECPNVLSGTFDQRYLALPPEVLITSMKEHQGFFSVVNRKQELLPRFFAPTNMPANATADKLIATGNERVLAARLADAQYFFHEDRKQTLVDRVPQLNGVVFHKRLGSLHQKTERIGSLIEHLADAAGVPELKAPCRRAALLSKVDLVTGMVGEFPTLQGVMGEKYAAHDGEPADVCRAIGEYYRPRTPDDDIPGTAAGRLLALADRLDTLAAFFYAGMVPSGSEDPYGLRRNAYGVVRIVIEAGLNLDLGAIVRQAAHRLDAQGVNAALPASGREGEGNPVALRPLLRFLEDRLRYYGRTVSGYREDVMESVLGRSGDAESDIRDLFLRMDALQVITGQQDFELLIVGFKRAHRIVEKEAWTTSAVQIERLTHQAERTLSRAVETAQHAIGQLLDAHEYHGALRQLIELKGPIDRFFEEVLVNAQEPEVRANRLSLLRQVDELFSAFGDLSQIQVQGR